MNATACDLPGVLVIQPDRFADERGAFLETYRRERYVELGIMDEFVQDNLSISHRHVVRGLHLQHPHDQAKLVWAASGTVFDVCVDVRRGSSTFGRWHAELLDAASARQLYIPRGFAHGFCAVSETAAFAYKCSAPYRAEAELTIAWNDPDLAIAWPTATPIVSPKDARAPALRELLERLPGAD